MTDKAENVVAFRVVPQDGPRKVKIRYPPWDECRHKHVELDEKHRTLMCLRCQRDVDPIYYLSLMAHEERSLDFRYEALKRAEEKARAAEEQKRKDCEARGHPVFRNHCRCGAMTRWMKEHGQAVAVPASERSEAPE